MAISRTRRWSRVILVVLNIGAIALAVQLWRVHQPGYFWAKAQSALRQGDLATAKLYLKNLLQRDPKHARGHLALAELYLREAEAQGQPASYAAQPAALAHLSRAAALRSNDLRLQRKLMAAMWDAGRVRTAARAARRVARLDQNDVDAQFLLAWHAVEAGEHARAEERFQEIQRLEPEPRFRTLTLKAQLCYESQDHARLEQTLATAAAEALAMESAQLAELDPRDRDAMINSLMWAVERAEDTDALHQRASDTLTVLEALSETAQSQAGRIGWVAEHAAQLTQLLPTHKPAHTDTATAPEAFDLLLRRIERLGRAAIEAGEASPLVYRQLAVAAVRQSDEDRAIEILHQGIAASAALPPVRQREILELHLLAARRLVILRRFREAQTHISPLLADQAYAGWGHLISGSVALAEGRLEEAHEHFVQARAAMGDTPILHLALAHTNLALSRWSDSLPHLAALHVDFGQFDEEQRAWAQRYLPSEEHVHRAEARAYLELGQTERALPHLEALKGTDYEPEALQLVAAYYWARHQREEAITLLQNARLRFPDNLGLLHVEMVFLIQQGRAKEAGELLERFAVHHPSDLAAQLAVVEWRTLSGKSREALADLEELQKRFPDQPAVRLAKAQWLLVAGDPQQALALAEELRRDPEIETQASLIGAHAALRLQNLEQAARMLAAATEDDLRDGVLSYWRGSLAAAEGDYESAVDFLSHALSFTTVRRSAREPLLAAIVFLAHEKSPREVETKLVKWLQEHPNEPALLLAKAELALQQGHFNVAMESLDRWERLQRESAAPIYYKAKAWRVWNRPDRSLDELHRALKLQPRHFPSRVLAAKLSLDLKHYAAALEHAVAALQQNPRRWDLYLAQAEALRHLGRDKEAIDVLQALIESQPSFPQPYATLAATHADAGRPEAALEVLSAGLDKLPSEMILVQAQVRILCQAGRPAEADQSAQQIWRDRPDTAALLQLALAFQDGGELERAHAWAERALQIANGQETLSAHLVLGSLCLVQYGQGGERKFLTEAHDHFRAVLEEDPHHFVAGNNLAWLLATEFDQPDEALKLAERVRDEASGDRLPLSFVDTLATIYRKTGRLERAHQMLSQAAEARPNEPLVLFHLGMVYAAAHQPAPARHALSKALQMGLAADHSQEAMRELAQLQAGHPGG